jgi:hypothetical protein
VSSGVATALILPLPSAGVCVAQPFYVRAYEYNNKRLLKLGMRAFLRHHEEAQAHSKMMATVAAASRAVGQGRQQKRILAGWLVWARANRAARDAAEATISARADRRMLSAAMASWKAFTLKARATRQWYEAAAAAAVPDDQGDPSSQSRDLFSALLPLHLRVAIMAYVVWVLLDLTRG